MPVETGVSEASRVHSLSFFVLLLHGLDGVDSGLDMRLTS